MADKKRPAPSEKKSISINGDVRDSNVFIGDNNLFQKFINYIFPSEKESLEQRNRLILLNHVENAWIKGVLDASLHGAALLDLGIKQDPEAVTQYPWTLKKESTDETLPAGTSMLEIFDSIGMGRSLLILGAPGSGKTTMLLELARGLIARAREDVTQPIPMVFNLASWTEKLTLADWLVQELNNLYNVPRKTAPDWVKGNKLLLLLDGLDEVRQDSRAKCVEAINAFRKEYGLTSLSVCSRSQDYADLNTKLSFEGAVEVQPLTQGQVTEFFNRFGDEMAGIKRVLKKDTALREMAETPLFLSIMLMAYRDKRDVEILISGDEKVRRKHLFETYVESMFERPRSKNNTFKKEDVLRWLAWLANKICSNYQSFIMFENIQPSWLSARYRIIYRLAWGVFIGSIWGGVFGVSIGARVGMLYGSIIGLLISFGFSLLFGLHGRTFDHIEMTDVLLWNWLAAGKEFGSGIIIGIGWGLVLSLPATLLFHNTLVGLYLGFVGLLIGIVIGAVRMLSGGVSVKSLEKTKYPGQRIFLSAKNTFIGIPLTGILFSPYFVFIYYKDFGAWGGILAAVIISLLVGFMFGGYAILQHFTLRSILVRANLLPWRLVPFLDHCVDLIFLRRVGGGYIFIHRLLMEHFAEMYVESPTSKRN